MKDLYRIYVSSVIYRDDSKYPIGLVNDTFENVKQVCEDMSGYKNHDFWDDYTFERANIEVLDPKGDIYSVFVSARNNTNVSEFDKSYLIKDNEKNLTEKITAISRANPKDKIEFGKAEIMTAEEMWQLYAKNMRNLKIDVSSYRTNNQELGQAL